MTVTLTHSSVADLLRRSWMQMAGLWCQVWLTLTLIQCGKETGWMSLQWRWTRADVQGQLWEVILFFSTTLSLLGPRTKHGHTLQWRRNLLHCWVCRQAHVDQLASSFSDRLSAMMRCGTTTVEAKTARVWAWPGERGEDAESDRESKEGTSCKCVGDLLWSARCTKVSYFSVELLLFCVVHVCSSILRCIMWQCTAQLHHSHMYTEYLCYCSCLVFTLLHFSTEVVRHADEATQNIINVQIPLLISAPLENSTLTTLMFSVKRMFSTLTRPERYCWPASKLAGTSIFMAMSYIPWTLERWIFNIFYVEYFGHAEFENQLLFENYPLFFSLLLKLVLWRSAILRKCLQVVWLRCPMLG